VLESKSLTFLSQQGMNRKMKKLSRQGWRVVSTTPNVLGGIVATLERGSSNTPAAQGSPRRSDRASACGHGDIHVVASIKHTHLCRSCDEVVKVTSQALPTCVDPESMRTLQEWVGSRPPNDALALFVTDSTARISS
jgi:hypothetical protein